MLKFSEYEASLAKCGFIEFGGSISQKAPSPLCFHQRGEQQCYWDCGLHIFSPCQGEQSEDHFNCTYSLKLYERGEFTFEVFKKSRGSSRHCSNITCRCNVNKVTTPVYSKCNFKPQTLTYSAKGRFQPKSAKPPSPGTRSLLSGKFRDAFAFTLIPTDIKVQISANDLKGPGGKTDPLSFDIQDYHRRTVDMICDVVNRDLALIILGYLNVFTMKVQVTTLPGGEHQDFVSVRANNPKGHSILDMEFTFDPSGSVLDSKGKGANQENFCKLTARPLILDTKFPATAYSAQSPKSYDHQVSFIEDPFVFELPLKGSPSDEARCSIC
mmetsp:Transcript_10591/g.20067  ORF Transcript_10591/g.20067 Transcript_10591/m.20067 type:complete len:326 (+) Transcript_10591:61-1038(+)